MYNTITDLFVLFETIFAFVKIDISRFVYCFRVHGIFLRSSRQRCSVQLAASVATVSRLPCKKHAPYNKLKSASIHVVYERYLYHTVHCVGSYNSRVCDINISQPYHMLSNLLHDNKVYSYRRFRNEIGCKALYGFRKSYLFRVVLSQALYIEI